MSEEKSRANKLAEIAFGQAFKPASSEDVHRADPEQKKASVDKLLDAFEEASRVDDGGVEFWYARDLQKLLGYTDYRNFLSVVQKAKEACVNSDQSIDNHFVDVNEMVEIGSKAEREIENIRLTRYASYLIAQNGDSRKREIAFAQTYFAIQTRRQEIQDEDTHQYTPLGKSGKPSRILVEQCQKIFPKQKILQLFPSDLEKQHPKSFHRNKFSTKDRPSHWLGFHCLNPA
ncbi:MAG TPA: BRO family protein [Acidobacteriaceae bacterium]|nr:BRO family protein [Acidobacteriaceae bacterium]